MGHTHNKCEADSLLQAGEGKKDTSTHPPFGHPVPQMGEGKMDTIVAPATALGRAGVGVIRLSGPLVIDIAQKISSKIPKPRYATYTEFRDDQDNIIDKGLVLFFPCPHSFTGEDVLELQVHGSPVIIDMLIKAILSWGARLARPGEFSERAFLNHKMDLIQAEAVADLINAGSEQAARAAMHSLEGIFSEKINHLNQQLIQLRVYIEAAMDFAEEEIDFLGDNKIIEKLEKIIIDLKNIQHNAKQGVLLQEGMTVVIAGKPNAGKSSLLNQLSGRDSAIVTHLPGTTRDILRERIHIDGLPLEIIDTAGLRESDDIIEQEGIKRAREMIRKADCVLYLRDITDSEPENDEILKHPKLILIYNKIDLEHLTPFLDTFSSTGRQKNIPNIKISAKTGEGIDLLKKYLKSMMGFEENVETGFSARRRHLDALRRADEFLLHAKDQLINFKALECAAEDLRLVQQALNEMTGEFTSDDLLGKIFSSFCIGK